MLCEERSSRDLYGELQLRRATTQDIAEAVGVSRRTVNRALHGQPRVSHETRQLIIETAHKLGYQPNRIAQALARSPVSVGVVYPDSSDDFYGPLVDGVRRGIQELQDHKISATFRAVSGLSCADEVAQMLRNGSARELDGLIVCPNTADHRHYDVWEQVADRGISAVFLGTGLPNVPHLTSVRLDARRCGRIAAELLGKLTSGRPAAVIVGSRDVQDHRDKIDGFCAESARLGIEISGVYEMLDDPDIGYAVASRIFQLHPETEGLYIANDFAATVCRSLVDNGRAGQTKVVATGIFPEMRELVQQSIVHFTLYQNMVRQGILAVRALYGHLAEKTESPKEILVPPVVVMQTTLELSPDVLLS